MVFAVVDVLPLNAMEERVVFHTCRTAGDIAESFGPVNGAELADYIFRVGGEGGFVGEVNRFGDDSEMFISNEGRKPRANNWRGTYCL